MNDLCGLYLHWWICARGDYDARCLIRCVSICLYALILFIIMKNTFSRIEQTDEKTTFLVPVAPASMGPYSGDCHLLPCPLAAHQAAQRRAPTAIAARVPGPFFPGTSPAGLYHPARS